MKQSSLRVDVFAGSCKFSDVCAHYDDHLWLGVEEVATCAGSRFVLIGHVKDACERLADAANRYCYQSLK